MGIIVSMEIFFSESSANIEIEKGRTIKNSHYRKRKNDQDNFYLSNLLNSLPHNPDF